MLQSLIKAKENISIGEIATVTDGIHTSIDYDDTSGINLISATSPRLNLFDLTRGAYISRKSHEMNPRTSLKKEDVILSTVGTIGNCAVVDDDILPANSDRHVGIIRLHTTIEPHVLSTFLLTKYGKNQTVRETTGNVQPNLFLYKIRDIVVPVFSKVFQSFISGKVINAKQWFKTAENIYKEAETLLLSALALDTFTPSRENTSVKNFSQISASGRLDAEYYQKKYDEIESKVKSCPNGYVFVIDSFNLVKDGFDKQKDCYPYIEIGDINIGEATAVYNVILTEELPANAKIKVQAGDILVSKVRPNRGAVAIVPAIPDLIVSGAFCVLRSTGRYSSEVLLVLLKSRIYREWLLKWNVGTSYPVIKDDDVCNLPLPLLPNDTQKVIAEKIRHSFALREKSKDLLKAATRAVEIAIEEDEAAAMDFLRQCLDK